jgi:hypothetical protein
MGIQKKTFQKERKNHGNCIRKTREQPQQIPKPQKHRESQQSKMKNERIYENCRIILAEGSLTADHSGLRKEKSKR